MSASRTGASVTSLQTATPAFTQCERERLQPWLSLTRAALTRTPRPLRRQIERVAWRSLASSGRLPGLLAHFPDGRTFRIDAGDVMYAQVFVFGAYEPAETAIVERLLRRGDFAVDIGANHGWFSLLMASTVGAAGAVWAVEPAGPTLERLRANVALNVNLPIEVKGIALGDHDGAVELHMFAGLPHGHASTSPLGRHDSVSQSVPQLTLDHLLDRPPARPALVKLDVEGAELSVLRGAPELLRSELPPIWMMEVNHETSSAFGYSPTDLLAPLNARGDYSVFRAAADGLHPERDAVAAPHGTTWICVPDAHIERARPLTVPPGR